MLKQILATKSTLLLSVIFIAVLARVYIVFFFSETWINVDSLAYIHQAEILLQGGFSNYFPNGYPLLIAVFMLFSSIFPLEISLVILNIILSSLIVFLVFISSETLFKERKYSFIAALLVAFYPNQLNFVRYLLTEVPAAFLLTLSFYLIVIGRIKYSGFTTGILAIIKTSFLPLGILFSFYLLFKSNIHWRAFLFYFLLPVSSMLLYGFIITGELTLSHNAFHNLTLTATDFKEGYVDKTTSVRDYWIYFSKNPIKFVEDRFASLWELWGPLASKTDKMRGNLFYRLLAGLRLPLLILALYSIYRLRNNIAADYMASAIFIVTIIHFFFFSSLRFTYPLEPLLILLAVKGWEMLFNRKKIVSSQLVAKEAQ